MSIYICSTVCRSITEMYTGVITPVSHTTPLLTNQMHPNYDKYHRLFTVSFFILHIIIIM
jgi:hypothetical protein